MSYFVGCSALGVLVGVLWGLSNQVHPACQPRPGVRALDTCTSHSFSVITLHWIFALGGGILAGALIGALLARTLVRIPE